MPLKTESGYDLDEHIKNALEGLEDALTEAIDNALKSRDLEWAEAVWGDFDIDGQCFNDVCYRGGIPGPDKAAGYVISLQGRHEHDCRLSTRKHPRGRVKRVKGQTGS